jgi:hypothetical protein
MAPSSPRSLSRRLEPWQGAASAVAGAFLLATAAGAGFLVADAYLPPEHLPWKPLALDRPLGAATRTQLLRSEGLACSDALRRGRLAFAEVAPSKSGGFCEVADAVRLRAALRPSGATMTCRQALAYALWERQVVQPAAAALFGTPVTAVEHYGSYACRTRYGREGAPASEHATANALDVAAFRLADGTRISVLDDWPDTTAKGQFLRRVRDGGCRIFSSALSPDYNAAHRDHLHLDMGGWRSCR